MSENKSKKVNKKEHKGIAWTGFSDFCKGCGLCIEKCPKKCLKFSDEYIGFYGTPAIDVDIEKCIGCKICDHHCPDCAIKVEKKKIS